VELNGTTSTPRVSRQRRFSRGRIVGAAVAAIAVGATLAASGPAQGLNTAKTGAAGAAGFPSHYTDDFGTSLELCIDESARCGGAGLLDDGAGGPGVGVPGDGEGFYWMATSTVRSPRGSIDVEFAHEAAWASATQRIVFDRTRIRGDLKPGRYTLLTPYGQTKFSAVGTGQRNVNQTQDPGCAQEPGARVRCPAKMTNWLRAVGAPVGYLGNSASLTQVRGGTFRNNLVLLDSTGRKIGSSSRFAVMGKIAANEPAAMLSTGAVMIGHTSKVVKRSVTLRNQGTAPLSLQGIRLTGAKTLTLGKTGCAARASLASGANCSINITYRPGLRRPSSARLLINDNTIAGSHRVPVKALAPR
jgi:hypothetical protein